MARYQLIASLSHPCEFGWTKEKDPKAWDNYCKIQQSIEEDTEATEAKAILLTHYNTISDNVETHDDWTEQMMLDEDKDAYYLFQKIPSATGIIGGEPFSAYKDIHRSLVIEYCNTAGEREWYFPCEEDVDYLEPFLLACNLGKGLYTEQKACEDIARIMKSWDYNIKL